MGSVVVLPPSDFVCSNASPGIGCGYWEMLFLGIIYLLSGFFCLFRFILCIIKYNSTKKEADVQATIEEPLNRSSSMNISSVNMLDNSKIINRNSNNDQSNNATQTPTTLYNLLPKLFCIFWFSMFLWLSYDGIITIVPFNYNELYYSIFFLDLDKIFSLVPLSFFVLIIIEICFAWRNPGARVIVFFRVVFAVFLFVFLLTGMMLSILCSNNAIYEDPSQGLSFWIASTDFLISLFIFIPSIQLIKLVSTPVVQPEDVCCVRTSKIGSIVLFIFFIIKFLFNLMRYFGFDYLSKFVSDYGNSNSDANVASFALNSVLAQSSTNNNGLSGFQRAYRFLQFFFFNLGTAWFAIVGAILLNSYDFKFLDVSQYTRTQNSISNM